MIIVPIIGISVLDWKRPDNANTYLHKQPHLRRLLDRKETLGGAVCEDTGTIMYPLQISDFPLLRVKVVGSVAYVLHETEWKRMVCHDDETAWSVGRQHYCLMMQVM